MGKNYISSFMCEKFSHLPIDEMQQAIADHCNRECNHTVNNKLSRGDRRKINQKNHKKIKYRRICEQQVSNLVPDLGKLNTEYSLIKESKIFKNPVEVINNSFPKVTATDTLNNSTKTVNNSVNNNKLSRSERRKIYKKKLKINKYRRICEQQASNLVPVLGKLNTEYSLIKESKIFKNPVEVINNSFPKVTATDTLNNSTKTVNNSVNNNKLSRSERRKIYKKKLKINKYRRICEQQASNLVPVLGKLNTEYSLVKESELFKNPIEVINTGFPKVMETDTSNNSTMDFMTEFETSSTANIPEALQITNSSSVNEPHVEKKLRPIIIDALNIGYLHGLGQFSAKGVIICVEYFANRGHNDIVVIIPQHKKRTFDIQTRKIFKKLGSKICICYTPSRTIEGIRMACYDDRIMLDYAQKHGGVVVSNDNYRDLYHENEAFKDIILNRHVMVTFMNDEIIVPEDQYKTNNSNFHSLSEMLLF